MRGSQPGFDEVYQAFHDRILRYLSRLVGDEEAQDVAQEVFLKVSSGLPNFRGDAQLSTWLYRIATNAAIDRLRSPLHRQVQTEIGLEEDVQEPGCLAGRPLMPDEQVMLKEMFDCFGGYLKDLPPAYRTVFILSDLEELPDRDIADILGISLETVKIRLHRGRSMLFKQLQQNCKAEDWL